MKALVHMYVSLYCMVSLKVDFGCQKIRRVSNNSTWNFLTPNAVSKTALGVKKFDVEFFDTQSRLRDGVGCQKIPRRIV